MILQLGVKPAWFNTSGPSFDTARQILGAGSLAEDLRSYIIDTTPVGDPAVPEMLLKVMEPYRKDGDVH